MYQRIGDQNEALSDAKIQYRYCALDITSFVECGECFSGCSVCSFVDAGNKVNGLGTFRGISNINSSMKVCTEYITNTVYDQENTRLFVTGFGFNDYTNGIDTVIPPPYGTCGAVPIAGGGGIEPVYSQKHEYIPTRRAIAYGNRGTICINAGSTISYILYAVECYSLETAIGQDFCLDAGGIPGDVREGYSFVEFTFLAPGDDSDASSTEGGNDEESSSSSAFKAVEEGIYWAHNRGGVFVCKEILNKAPSTISSIMTIGVLLRTHSMQTTEEDHFTPLHHMYQDIISPATNTRPIHPTFLLPTAMIRPLMDDDDLIWPCSISAKHFLLAVSSSV